MKKAIYLALVIAVALFISPCSLDQYRPYETVKIVGKFSKRTKPLAGNKLLRPAGEESPTYVPSFVHRIDTTIAFNNTSETIVKTFGDEDFSPVFDFSELAYALSYDITSIAYTCNEPDLNCCFEGDADCDPENYWIITHQASLTDQQLVGLENDEVSFEFEINSGQAIGGEKSLPVTVFESDYGDGQLLVAEHSVAIAENGDFAIVRLEYGGPGWGRLTYVINGDANSADYVNQLVPDSILRQRQSAFLHSESFGDDLLIPYCEGSNINLFVYNINRYPTKKIITLGTTLNTNNRVISFDTYGRNIAVSWGIGTMDYVVGSLDDDLNFVETASPSDEWLTAFCPQCQATFIKFIDEETLVLMTLINFIWDWLWGQVIDVNGNEIVEFKEVMFNFYNQKNPLLTILPNKDYAMVLTDQNVIKGFLSSSNFQNVTDQFPLVESQMPNQGGVQIAKTVNSKFVITWAGTNGDTLNNGNNFSIYYSPLVFEEARFYASNPVMVKDASRELHKLGAPKIAINSDGLGIISWYSKEGGGRIYFRRYLF